MSFLSGALWAPRFQVAGLSLNLSPVDVKMTSAEEL